MIPRLPAILLIFGMLWLMPAGATDAAKEKRWADQIVDALITGEAVWLEAGGHRFLGIWTEAESAPVHGGIVLVHGMGVHPDWPDVIHPLRTALPEHGWATLSIQMPVLPNEAKVEDYAPVWKEAAPRLKAAVAFLRRQNIENIAIVAHSLGASMAASFLAAEPRSGVAAFVAIGMSNVTTTPEMSSVRALEKIRIPVLDLYGENDLDAVLASAPARAAAARRAGNDKYGQRRVPGADHFFAGMEETLVRHVRTWLRANAPGVLKKKR